MPDTSPARAHFPTTASSRRTRSVSSAASLALLAAIVISPRPARAASLVEVTGFGSNPGNLRMFKYVPDSPPSNMPLVVAMHGCTQSASSYDNESGWTKIADTYKVSLVLPQQQSSNNASSCFNWFEDGDDARGAGEALSIKQMVDNMKANHSINASKVFATGLSSGGAMTPVMLATYPDVFAGGAIVAGIPYKCASGVSDGFSCMSPGKNLTPQQWGDKVRAAFPSWTGPWPVVSIWHGDSDNTVKTINQTESMEQWTNVHGIDQTPDVQDTIKGYPHKVYKNASGAPLVETYTITGMDHGQPLDPGTGSDQCGVAGAFMLDVNICAAYFIAQWFGINNVDSQSPSVSITSPSNGATVSGSVSVTATASDNVAVTKVEFFVDTTLLSMDTTSPYSATWDAATATNGSHNLGAKAYDAAGNVGTSSQVSVTVTGGVADTTAPTTSITFPTNGATVSGTIEISASASDDTGVTSVEFLVDGGSIGTGTPAGQAGPWTIQWNTTSATNGAHTIQARASDAAGNLGTSSTVNVTVDQNATALTETFSDKDASGDYFDNTGWTVNGFVSDTSNHSTVPAGSSSTFGYASSGVGCQTGLKTKSLSRSVTLKSNPNLSYWRKLDLHALINISTTASFTVKVNGTAVDSKSVTYANYAESAWTERANISLATWANQTVTLLFEVAANSNVCLEAWSKAWLDDIVVSNPQQASDTTPPTVNLTAPANGATVSGTVDLQASASDNVGVVKVEFFVDGTLLDVDTVSPYSVPWTTTGVTNGSHSLMAKSYDAAGNAGTDDDTSVTVSNGGGGSTSVSFSNQDANDGYVKALSDGSSPEVGTLEGSYGLGCGRGADGKFNRTLFSFDTSSIPDGTAVTRAYVTVTLNSYSGNPWTNPAGNTLTIDVKNGCFGACTIETGDWAAAATANDVASIARWTSGTTNSAEFSAGGLGAINKAGTTQLKLRFSLNQTAMNYIFIGHGTTATLHVDYV